MPLKPLFSVSLLRAPLPRSASVVSQNHKSLDCETASSSPLIAGKPTNFLIHFFFIIQRNLLLFLTLSGFAPLFLSFLLYSRLQPIFLSICPQCLFPLPFSSTLPFFFSFLWCPFYTTPACSLFLFLTLNLRHSILFYHPIFTPEG